MTTPAPVRDLTVDGLAGTFVLPVGVDDPSEAVDAAGPRPLALLLPGSGPVDRDSNHPRLPLDVTRQLAVDLAEGGVASFRYDKRGVGESPGDWRAAGFWDGVRDAEKVLAALREMPEVDPERVVVVGHSEGAVIAAALAARQEEAGTPVAGIVLLAGSARPGQQVLLWQARRAIDAAPRVVRGLLRVLPGDPVDKIRANHDKLRATTSDVTRIGLARINAKWFREFLDHDPAEDLARTSAPVLAITGAKDLQVPADDLDVIAARAGGTVETFRLDDLTHTLRTQHGAPSLSAYKREAREPVAPVVLDLVREWVLRISAGR